MPRRKSSSRCAQLASARDAKLENKKQKMTDDEREVLGKDEGGQASNSSAYRDCEDTPQASGGEQKWYLAHVQQTTKLIQELLCPLCLSNGLHISIDENEHDGFSSKIKLECGSCGYTNTEDSSPRINESESTKVAFEINPKMVMLSHELGKSHTGLQTIGAVLGIPSMHLKSYQRHDKKLTGIDTIFTHLLKIV